MTAMPRFAVIGLGRFGEKLAKLLTQAGAEVIGIDSDAEIVQRLRDDVSLTVRMDSTDEQALLAQGVDKVDCAIVGIGLDFEANALTVSTLKKIGVSRVISRAGSGKRGKILQRIGADDVVFPEDESAARWANRLIMPQFADFLELDEDHSLVQVPTPRKFIGKTPRQLELRAKLKLNLVAIRRPVSGTAPDGPQTERWQVVGVADPDVVIRTGDILVLTGNNTHLSQLSED